KQQRSGINGAPFTLYKFRTMITNAEQFKHELEAMNEMRGPVFKVTNDPRITPIGKFLRRYSLDELPQLWNVLWGDMSLVGPRPERPEFTCKFSNEYPDYHLRHSVRGGLTGYAQIHGWRGYTSLEERLRHDLYYVRHWSVLFDLYI